MTDVKLPPLPKGKYQWWDDYYTGISLSEEPEDRYHQLGLYDEDQVREYARLAVLQERERCAKICDDIEDKAYALWKITADPTEQGRELGACHCADAIRKGE